MTPSQRWQEIDRIFAAALERDGADRSAFLDEACAGDSQLRKEVESLLAHDIPESLVGSAAVDEATRLLLAKGSAAPDNENIGPYQIIRSLGAGGMGRVYLAYDKRLNRQVAVKLLSFYDETEKARVRRFRQEALAASALNHPNILTIYEIGETEGHNYIASEFVDGQTLLALIGKGNVSLAAAVDIGIQTASALAAAHAAGIIHRDIKPANIMHRADGLLKVLDFGIAKYIHPESGTKESLVETMPGTVIGTAAYMSPEQARGNEVDCRTDIWSLGVILYELLTGNRPFLGETVMDVLSAVIERPPPPLSSHNLIVPESFERIVFKALQKERDTRYQTCGEMLADLKELARKLESPLHAAGEEQTAPPAVVSTSPESVKGLATKPEQEQTRSYNPRSRRVLFGSVLLLLPLVLASLIYWTYANRSPPIESIAVMPFVNANQNSELEYLSDGMTDMLITSLSQVPKLSVKARSSVFRYKGKDASPQQLGKELNVQAILTGRVLQRGSDLTLHVELVVVQTETVLWSHDYSRSTTNLVALQGEIARDVSQKLRARLSGAEERKVSKDYTANSEAKDLYLKGRFHVFKLTPQDTITGVSYLQRAIQLDPNYALAYVGLAEAYRTLALSAEVDPNEFFPKSREAAQKALDLDPDLAEAHAAVAVTNFWYGWDWNGSETQFKRALALNQNNPDTHLSYAHLLSNTGRHAEALVEAKRARELDPYSPLINALEGQFLTHAGMYDEALIRLRETFELAPGFWFPHCFAASAYIEKGMFAEGIAEARRANKLADTQTASVVFEGCALAKSGKIEETRVLLDGLLKRSKERFVPPSHIAMLYNALGQRDEAIAWLERGFAQRDPKMTFLKVQPRWNNLRADPRFMDILKRMGLS